MSDGGRFFMCSDLILSRPGAVRFLTDKMTCRISEGRTKGGRIHPVKDDLKTVDMAIKEVGVEIVNDVLPGARFING
ncbi:unnamed protein product [Heligmosomoides polygyrus]|uniref:PEPCK_N domain-containing protein n=1 Tax=Heligmosomoides polygyrus TaxID=6339 RepID=A0A183G1F9_HELPZ|nr:unnamed protein product [Heligmosomoides polygyrus]